MKEVLRSFPQAFKMIFKDPINLILAIIPTLLALALYLYSIGLVYRNSDRFVSFFRGYIYTSDQATVFAKILTAILIVFIFFMMSWTFVIIVGIIAAPFNVLLSSRVEDKYRLQLTDSDSKKAIKKIKQGLGQTFMNELKKLTFIGFMAVMAFILNLFPLFYPLGVFLLAILFSVQFIDYSWSRHELSFKNCFKDVLSNIIPYSASGFIFLLFATIPIVNALVPALATSYYTVLWIQRRKI